MSDSSGAAQSKHSLWSNTRFVFSTLWKWGRATIPLSLVAATSEVFMPFIAIFLPKLVIDALSTGNAEAMEFVKLIGLATLLLAIVGICGHYANRLIYMQALHNRIRYALLTEEKNITMDYANIEDPAGQTARQKAYEALNSNNSGGEAMVVNLANLFAHGMGLFLYTILVASLNPWIIILMLGGSALSVLAMRKAQNYEAARRDELAELAKKATYIRNQSNDYLNGKDVRLYDMPPWLNQLQDRLNVATLSIHARTLWRYFAAEGLDTAIAFVRDSLSYAYLITLVFDGQITVGDFTLLFGAIAGISTWISKITVDLNLVMAASRELGYFRDFLEIPDAPRETSSKTPMVSEAPGITFENVSFRYPGSEQWILRNFDLCIRPGEKMALVGVNGAGKTTCVKLMTGLYRPTEGRILIDGYDIQTFERERLFELFAPVFQEVRILAMDLQRNVALLPNGQGDSERVRSCLKQAGLDEKLLSLSKGLQTQLTRALDDEGIDLSGGQAQKLMLARALYKDAAIVIMDEPTAALDPLAESELYQRYNEMVGHKTSLYISHRLASTHFCDRIAFISGGRVSELGSHEELMELGGAYGSMFAVQAHYYQEDIEDVKEAIFSV